MKEFIATVALVVVCGLGLALSIDAIKENRADCPNLERDLKVFAACHPQVGCMASYSEVIGLNERMEACANASAIR